MRKLFCYSFVLCSGLWGQAVSPIINPFPTRQFGHPVSENLANPPTQSSPNLVEGREVDAPGQIAFDTSTPTPVLYIADIGNNRVLAYKNPAGVQAGKPADVVIGQADLVSTLPAGPGTALETGLNSPTGVAVDSQGRLYVADAGNNRIMRFPQPLTQPNTPDLVIGQQGFGTGNSANENAPCSSKTLAFSSSGVQFVTLAIDASGNLWTADPLNNRVLMFPVANLTANAVAPVATVVLGQNSFTTCSVAQNTNPIPQLTKTIVADPSGVAFDAAGNLYVVDGYSRVLYYTAPLGTGQAASRVLGIFPPTTSGGSEVYPTNYTLGAQNPSNPGNLFPPTSVFTNGTNLFVADTYSNRIVEYDIPSKWAAESTAFPSPAALNVFGQVGFNSGQANQGAAQPNSSTLYSPNAGAFLGNQMWISDTGNNRVLGFSINSAATYSNASVLIGQLDYIYNAPNLIVGSEVFLGGASGSASGVVVDNSSTPPHLYISDPGNNRVLCFENALTVASSTTTLPVADKVIGQPDLKTSEINYPNGVAGQPSQTGLYSPIGVAVDNNGNLYVADSGNGRVVRFPAPFNQSPGAQPMANLVLGQASFSSFIQNASSSSMHTPWGLALFADVAGATPLAGSIAVSDPSYNRVLIFKKGAGGDFQNGQVASTVIGQPSFSSTTAGNSPAQLYAPRGIASDTSDRLYIADTNNGRVMEFTQAPEGTVNGPTSSNSLTGLNSPQAVAVNSQTTELWVANSNSGSVYRYPEYNTCILLGCAATAQLPSYIPLGLAVDASGNLIVGDLYNRITFYYAALFFRNAANFNTQALTPGMLAILGREGLAMTVADGQAQTSPWPMTVGGVNVTVNGIPAPIYATNSGYGAIYFQVPYETQTSGTSTVIVTNSTTNAVVGVGSFTMAQANPGFFTTNAAGTGPVAATNSDGTVNSASNAAARGSSVTFYLTGLGPTPSNPLDGAPPGASNVVNTPVQPDLIIGSAQATVSYSGVGGGFAGGWQINATVPMTAVPGAANAVALTYYGIRSNIGGNPTNNSNGTPGQDVVPISTTVYVK